MLGLDIGQYAIKGIRVAESFRGLRLIDSFERKVARGGMAFSSSDPLGEGQIEALKQLLSEGKIRSGEKIALALPGHLASTREITLPFTDPKKIRQLVPYEMEGQLPFDLEAVSIGFQLLAPGPGADPTESRLLASALPKDLLKKYLDRLQPLGLDPAWIGIDASSLFASYRAFSGGEVEGEDLLLIDAGASKTVLCGVQGKRLKWVRTLPMGGDLLTEALRKEFQLSWEEAEKLKEEIDLNQSDPAPYQRRAIDCLKAAAAPWLTEMEKSVRRTAPSSSGAASPSASYFLCGGGGRLRGFKESLSERLQMEPIAWEWSAPDGKGGGISGIETIDTAILRQAFVQAIGSVLAAADGSGINFRQGEFVFGKETIEKRNRIVSVGLVFLLLAALMGGDFYFRYHEKERRFQDLKGRLRGAFTQLFPQSKNVLNEVEQIRAAIADLNRTGAFFGVGEERPLDVLKEVTAAIPKEIRIDVQDLVIEGNKIRIEAQTDSYESIDRIRGGLLKGSRFQEVNVGDAKVGADPSKVGFRIQMTAPERGKVERK